MLFDLFGNRNISPSLILVFKSFPIVQSNAALEYKKTFSQERHLEAKKSFDFLGVMRCVYEIVQTHVDERS